MHLLLRVPEDMDGSKLIAIVKSNAAKRLLPLLNDQERRQLSDQQGLNRRQFWKVSFRGFPILTHQVRSQKLNYIHENPVKAQACNDNGHYRWCSSWLWEEDEFCADLYELDLERVLGEFAGAAGKGWST